MKTCSKCHIDKDDSEFRLRTEKRPKRARKKIFVYLSNACRKCEAKLSLEYYMKKRLNPDFKKKNRDRVKAYNKRTEKSKKQWEARKNDPKWIEKIKKYRQKNKDRLAVGQKARSKAWHKRNCIPITDSYCITLILRQVRTLTREEIRRSPELIEIKRTEVLIHRLKKATIKNEQ